MPPVPFIERAGVGAGGKGERCTQKLGIRGNVGSRGSQGRATS
jgi:hypothetical protein